MSIGFGAASSARVELVEAARQGLSHAEVAVLAQSHHRAVREAVAARPDVPLGVLATLANDSCHQVRAAVAANRRAARSLIEHLCTDHHPDVARGLVHNEAVPREVLAVLAGHRKADVRDAALRRLDSAPLARAEADPDARFPELRDRVAHAPVPALHVAPVSVSAQVPVTYASSLSLLAQRISLGAAAPAATPASASALASAAAPVAAPAPAPAAMSTWPDHAADQRFAVAAAF